MNIILIPAYEPNQRLITLIKEIKDCMDAPIVVVNDGSDGSYDPIFNDQALKSVILLKHEKNMGKGKALKTGISYIKKTYPHVSYIITCDADGQHITKDILKINNVVLDLKDTLVLGTRHDLMHHVPLRSRIGNRFSSFFFYLNTHQKCSDTQTGLRAIPSILFDEALQIEDNRFDYEMTFLMAVASSHKPIQYIDIDTVYLENNQSSHFRPIKDSILIYKQPIKFTIIALTSAIIDIGIFSLLIYFFQGTILEIVAYATVIARLSSGFYNFLLNRIWSFKSKSHLKKDFTRYLILYIVQLILSILLVSSLSYLIQTYTINKIIIDSLLFIMSYYIQKYWVFKKQPKKAL